MPEVGRFFEIIIRMYFGDHNPPHLHAEYQEFTAKNDIETLTVIRGSMLIRAHKMVLESASLLKEELIEDWQLAAYMMEIKKMHQSINTIL